jgi:hypothetical protein
MTASRNWDRGFNLTDGNEINASGCVAASVQKLILQQSVNLR